MEWVFWKTRERDDTLKDIFKYKLSLYFKKQKLYTINLADEFLSMELKEILNSIGDNEVLPISSLREVNMDEVMPYFKKTINLEDNEELFEQVLNEVESSFKIRYSIHLKNYLVTIIPDQLNNKQTSLLEVMCIQYFLKFAHLLVNEKSDSTKELFDIRLRIYTYRFETFRLILKSSISRDSTWKEIIQASYEKEFEKFVDFITNYDFKLYMLPHDLKKWLHAASYSTTEGEDIESIQIDTLVDYLIDDFSSRKKEKIMKYNNQFIKLQNIFYLPRFDVDKNFEFEQSNIFGRLLEWFLPIKKAPRLVAAIVIGLIPVLMTGELNEWAFNKLPWLIGNEINYFGIFLTVFVFIISCWICKKYIDVEVKNVLGYTNFASRRKSNVLFSKGLRCSFSLTLIGHLFFTSKFMLDLLDTLKEKCDSNLPKIFIKDSNWIEIALFKEKCVSILPKIFIFNFNGIEITFFPEYFVIQFSIAFLLGLIIQAVWEDKPITQPL
ncbi:hypothetical protein [Bacillus sp. 165]|uniref:hypothetical protein n=1 Tax=Bacillus sp. 165 TaxID=1529117 RepID=UPI001ADC96A4|nr:hypothetical protein [Bacillus sp. 165]MBO9129094.1 hypothetical protein [Bacillus sp. 165]